MPEYLLTYSIAHHYRLAIEADSPADARVRFLMNDLTPGCHPQLIDVEIVDSSFMATPLLESEPQG